ncbi:MAG: IS4 family transposase [Alphaproteobacteria bacterium]|nr:MAG: IS4 family transposase [Alphaproteobacteria bacterium]
MARRRHLEDSRSAAVVIQAGMEHAQLDSEEWSHIVMRLGGAEALALSAREYRAFVRARGVRSAHDLLRLALMYGPGGHSLRSVAAMAGAAGLADVSEVAVLGRLKAAADWLEHLCKQQLALFANETGVSITQRPIRIVDGSRIEGPGDRVWRLHLCYDANRARIADAVITTTKEGERLDRLAVTRGEIRLGDRGFPQPDGIRNTLDEGADVLVRLTWNSLQLSANAKPIDWLKLFKQAGEQGAIDMPVRVHKAHSKFQPIDMRLVMIKKPPAAAAKSRVKARRASQKNQRRTDPRTLAGADYVILLTSLKPEEFPINLIAALYRLRWQIELAIKRLKSILHIDRVPAKNPQLARAWLYAHLLLALILDKISAELGAIPPSAAGMPANLALAYHHPPRRRIARGHLAAA